MRKVRLWQFAIGIALSVTWGCTGPIESPQAAPPRQIQVQPYQALIPATRPAVARLPPLLLHLPGIGGTRSIDLAMVHGFVKGGFTGAVEIYDWTEGDSGIDALRSLERNKREAGRIAAKLADRCRLDPGSKIYLTCHSGGAGLAVWALEDLPPDVTVQTLVFMSPALSPSYDLSRALHHVRGRAYAFTSLSDNLVLGYGTRVFGTIDGVKTDAAGRVGFSPPPSADAEQYAKLVTLAYDPAWARFHDYGDHVGGMTRAFAQNVLAPLVMSGILPSPVPLFTMPVSGTPLHLPVPATLPALGR